MIWGMSGGSMIAQVSAHPDGLEALILDSAGPCFRATLQDADCVLSPASPRRRDALAAAGLTGGVPRAPLDDTRRGEVPSVGWVLRRPFGAALVVAPPARLDLTGGTADYTSGS